VLGEGSGILFLELLESAITRGAAIYAEIVGYGVSGDAFHISAPSEDGDGPIRVMNNALRDARVEPSAVAYINAHGTSTPAGDRIESLAIRKVFGESADRVAVSSTKSMIGHLLGAAGGVETAITVLSVYHGVMPPTINYEERDPDCDLDFVPNKAREAAIEYALCNSFGFGGTNACIVIRKYLP
jgi:3-oxoacyl-[acyl-carrier-protein] synthase II